MNVYVLNINITICYFVHNIQDTEKPKDVTVKTHLSYKTNAKDSTYKLYNMNPELDCPSHHAIWPQLQLGTEGVFQGP